MDFIKKIKDEFTTTTSSSSSGSHTQDWYITIVRGEGIKDEGLFSRSDPYLKIEFGGKHFKTRTIKNERSPVWNETFHFQLKPDQAKDIVLTLMDDDIGFDDHMGRATISKVDLPEYSEQEKYLEIPIKKNDQITGLVHIRAKLVDNSMQQQQQQLQQQQQQPQLLQQQQQPQQQPQRQQINQSSFQSPNIPYQQQQTSQLSSGFQQQPMSYDGMYTQPQQFQGQSSQQYSSSQFQQDYNTSQTQHHQHHQHQSNVQPRSNDNYYGKQ